jgi:hypothetical protein
MALRLRNPDLTRVAAIGSNMTEAIHGRATILYSYETPVAAHVEGIGYFKTDKKWSVTTSRHINKWLESHGASGAVLVPQEEIERIARKGDTEHGKHDRGMNKLAARFQKEDRASNPGKFSDTVEELLYTCDHDQTVGSVDELGWYGMVSGMLKPEAIECAKENGIELDPQDIASYHWPLNAIIRENSDGHIEVEAWGPPHSNRDMLKVWRDIEAMYDKYYAGGEE